MKKYSQEVSSQSAVVGVVEDYDCETMEELKQKFSESKIIELVNTQHRTNLMNAMRAAASGKVSKKQLREDAYNEILAEVAAGGHKDLLAQGGIPTLIEKRMEEIEARLKASRPVVTAGDTAADEG